MSQTTNFLVNGVEIGTALDLLDKEYVIENYPEISNVFKQAGLWMWGYNIFGHLGDNTIIDKSSPVQTVASGANWKTISCGFDHTAAIKTDGTLWLWGYNSDGGLGDNTSTNKSSPVQTVSGGTDWKQIDCGDYHTAAIKTDGTLWLWGYNSYGQLGDNTTARKSSPVQTVAGGTDWSQVSCGSGFVAAIKTDGTLWLWGLNGYGQLGDNTQVWRSSPVQTVSGGTNWKQVSCGALHTGAIKTDGTLWLWGGDYFSGPLGNNSRSPRSSPVQTVAGGTNWKQVSCGGVHTAAIKTDGTLWMWGSNVTGELGDGTSDDKSSPVQTISGGTNWKTVICSHPDGYYTAAIKTDGTLWLWGENGLGQLGDDTLSNRSSPIQTISTGTNWKSVAVGYYSTAAIRDDSMDQL